MQNAAAGTDDGFGPMVADLISLIAHVRASIGLIDDAIARGTSSGDPDSSDVIVLDDVTPQYMKASRALQACSSSLDTALQSVLEARASARRPTLLAHG